MSDVMNKRRAVIVDARINAACEAALRERGFEVIKAQPSPFLPTPVASHPDMLFFVGKGHLVCEKRYFNSFEADIRRIALVGGLRVTVTDEETGEKYPGDVLFNAAPIGEYLICRRASTSSHILKLYDEDKIINVKQGYAKCSTCTVGDSGIITADASIASAASRAGADILLLREHGVALEGYGCGFIGGASGDDGENIYFCGNAELHPEYENIKSFCEKHSRGCVSLSDSPLYDYGTLVFI